ncbi:MAG: phosphoenolpyruvate carboxylase, partial [Candidatus Hydrogenedentes bacterium]|nr:phosphoenolpyruvate carboxylase [Candidatus Hydrogenedentota bacterium]
VSRGAGPTHRFLGSLPHGSLQSHFRLTEQGEIIAQKYGNPATAAYNLELLLAGVTATALKHRTTPPETDLPVDMATQLNAYSSEAYSDLLKGQYFLGFWKHATPIDALEHSNIGSRPARRTGRQTLDDLRAIPWVFSWSQARYYLPGWYGLGSALERFAGEDAGHIDLLRKYANGNPFLRYVLYNAETSLASADLDIMYAYAELVPDASIRDRFYNLIAEEYRRTDSMINEIFGGTRAQRRPRKTLDMREDGLHRLHTIQIRLLREWRQRKADNDTKGADAMLPSLLLSINAIASGLRTTG